MSEKPYAPISEWINDATTPTLEREFYLRTISGEISLGKDGKDGLDGKDGVDGGDGKDGVSVVSTSIDANGDLLVTLSNGQTVNAGRAKGIDGIDGEVSNADLELKLGSIRGASLGIVGDGVTDDTAALTQALTYASQRGAVLSLEGSENVKISGVVYVPANTVFDGGGCTISVPTTYGNVAFSIQGNNVSLKNFKVVTDTSVSNNTRGIAATDRTNLTFENIYIESNLPGAGTGSMNRTGISLTRCEDVVFSNFNVKNYEYPVAISECKRIRYSGGVIDTYVRGLYMTETRDSVFSNVTVQGLSPNAAVQPGHNGVLIGTITPFGTENLRFENIIVKNSGEHGFRIGSFIPISNIIFDKCISMNAGASGFKCLGGQTGGTSYHEDISYVDCTVIDAGNIENMTAGFMMQFVRRGRVINPTVIKRNKTYSAAYGVEFQAIQGLIISNPIVRDTQNAGIKMGFVLGDITDVIIDGGTIECSSGHAVWFDYTNRTMRRVKMINSPTLAASGAGFNIHLTAGATGTAGGACSLSWYSIQNAALQVSDTSTTVAFSVDVLASFDPLLHGSMFRNGSVWQDTNLSTGAVYHRVGSVWRKPVYEVVA